MNKIKKFINFNDKIFVAGHIGMVGKAVCRSLEKHGYRNIITCDRIDLDLSDSSSVDDFMNEQKPNNVVLAAAKVGGIYACLLYTSDAADE